MMRGGAAATGDGAASGPAGVAPGVAPGDGVGDGAPWGAGVGAAAPEGAAARGAPAPITPSAAAASAAARTMPPVSRRRMGDLLGAVLEPGAGVEHHDRLVGPDRPGVRETAHGGERGTGF